MNSLNSLRQLKNTAVMNFKHGTRRLRNRILFPFFFLQNYNKEQSTCTICGYVGFFRDDVQSLVNRFGQYETADLNMHGVDYVEPVFKEQELTCREFNCKANQSISELSESSWGCP